MQIRMRIRGGLIRTSTPRATLVHTSKAPQPNCWLAGSPAADASRSAQWARVIMQIYISFKSLICLSFSNKERKHRRINCTSLPWYIQILFRWAPGNTVKESVAGGKWCLNGSVYLTDNLQYYTQYRRRAPAGEKTRENVKEINQNVRCNKIFFTQQQSHCRCCGENVNTPQRSLC